MTAGAFSFGFIVSADSEPDTRQADGSTRTARGERTRVVLIGTGLLLATLVSAPWQLYATLGMLVGAGSVCLGYTGQGLFLPNWFARRRGLAMSLAFSGVGVGSVIRCPGWRP